MNKYRYNIDLNEEEKKKLDELTIALYQQGFISSLNKSKLVKEILLGKIYNKYHVEDK